MLDLLVTCGGAITRRQGNCRGVYAIGPRPVPAHEPLPTRGARLRRKREVVPCGEDKLRSQAPDLARSPGLNLPRCRSVGGERQATLAVAPATRRLLLV